MDLDQEEWQESRPNWLCLRHNWSLVSLPCLMDVESGPGCLSPQEPDLDLFWASGSLSLKMMNLPGRRELSRILPYFAIFEFLLTTVDTISIVYRDQGKASEDSLSTLELVLNGSIIIMYGDDHNTLGLKIKPKNRFSTSISLIQPSTGCMVVKVSSGIKIPFRPRLIDVSVTNFVTPCT